MINFQLKYINYILFLCLIFILFILSTVSSYGFDLKFNKTDQNQEDQLGD